MMALETAERKKANLMVSWSVRIKDTFGKTTIKIIEGEMH